MTRRNHEARRWLAVTAGGLGTVLCGALTACHSAFINATISNQSGQALRLVEIDYPSASFGTNDLANGATFKYRFKVLGSGPATLLWTDHASQDHKVRGPALEEGQEGQLSVIIGPGGAHWDQSLHH